MGRKVNPKILRITTISRRWDPKWFADRRLQYRAQLKDDLYIRKYIDSKLRLASIARVEIARDQQDIVLTIHTSRPAVVIGRGGSGIEQMQEDLKKIIGAKTKVRINVQEIRNPDTDATAIATQIIEQLERRMPFRRALKQAVGRAQQSGAIGVRVALAGRLNGADIARTEWLSEGNVPLHTFRADISYSQMEAHTTYGIIGVKVWINRGEVTTTKKPDQPGTKRQPAKIAKRSHRTSLADKVSLRGLKPVISVQAHDPLRPYSKGKGTVKAKPRTASSKPGPSSPDQGTGTATAGK